MTDHIIKAAREAGFGSYAHEAQSLFERFYAIAYRAGLEKAAEICEEPYEFTSQEATLLAQAIRAHAQNIDMTAASCTKSEGN